MNATSHIIDAAMIQGDISNNTNNIINYAEQEAIEDWNFTWSSALIDGLVMAGATNFVMSPGAQAAPLMMACRANSRAKITLIIDERSAAFYALGQARVTGTPTVIICTSGSAVGQLYPAIMEASAIQAPLIVLAADRTPERMDCGAAQAIDQIRVFGSHVRAAHHLPSPDHSIGALASLAARIVDQSLFPSPGPVYVNQPFREPLYAKILRKHVSPIAGPSVTRPILNASPQDVQSVADRLSGRPGFILCGAAEADSSFAEAAHHLAQALACPIIADPLSGLRFGAPQGHHVITRADSLSHCRDFVENFHPEWVISFCGPPISKNFLSWLKDSKLTDYIVVDDSTRWQDPLRRATQMMRADPASFCRDLAKRVKPAPSDWMKRVSAFERCIDVILGGPPDDLLWEAPIIDAILAAVPDNGILFSANSMSVRDFDTFSGTTAKRLRLLANRGVNGIDGSIATVLGVASRSDHATLAMIGDVAFAHDMGSLQIANDLDVLLVILNNAGGAIFDYQGAAYTQDYPDFICPPTVDISAAAGACGWKHWQADTLRDFRDTLQEARSAKGCRVVEAVIERKASVDRHRAFWASVSRLAADAAE